jgi:hypothetical protein
VPEADLAKMLGKERTLGISSDKLASYADALRHGMGPLFFVISASALLALVVGMAFPQVRVKKRDPGAVAPGRAKPEPRNAESNAAVQAVE